MSLYNYTPNNVIKGIDSIHSLYDTSYDIDQMQLNIIEMSKYFQGNITNAGIDYLYRSAFQKLNELYECIIEIDCTLDSVREIAVKNQREEEEAERQRQAELERQRQAEAAAQAAASQSSGSTSSKPASPQPTSAPSAPSSSSYGNNSGRR